MTVIKHFTLIVLFYNTAVKGLVAMEDVQLIVNLLPTGIPVEQEQQHHHYQQSAPA